MPVLLKLLPPASAFPEAAGCWRHFILVLGPALCWQGRHLLHYRRLDATVGFDFLGLML